MKNLSKISLLLLLGLAAVSVPAFSATGDATAAKSAAGKHAKLHAKLVERRAKLRAHAVKRLELSDAQKEQLKAKRAETKAALKAVKDDASLSKEQKHAKARELLAGARTNFRSVLTPEQQGKLDQMREKAAKHRKHRRSL